LLAPFDACAPSKVLMIPLHWHHQQTGNPADRSKTTSPAVVNRVPSATCELRLSANYYGRVGILTGRARARPTAGQRSWKVLARTARRAPGERRACRPACADVRLRSQHALLGTSVPPPGGGVGILLAAALAGRHGSRSATALACAPSRRRRKSADARCRQTGADARNRRPSASRRLLASAPPARRISPTDEAPPGHHGRSAAPAGRNRRACLMPS
jgi:hypothetical protein